MFLIQKKFFFLCFIASLLATLSNAQIKLEYDSGYQLKLNSNRAISNFSHQRIQNINQFYELSDRLFKKKSLSLFRSAYKLGTLIYKQNIENNINLAFHEYGHASRAIAIGYQASYQKVYSFQNQHYATIYQNYYKFLLDLFDHSNYEGAWVIYAGQSFSSLSFLSTAQLNAIISAGGVNNESDLAVLMADQIYSHNQASFLDIFWYSKNKLSVYLYSKDDEENEKEGDYNGDISKLLQFYNTSYDLNMTHKDIQKYNLIAFVLSASTWQYINTGIVSLLRDQNQVKTFNIPFMRLPELDFYLNYQGPSYKLRSALKLSSTMNIPFAYEKVIKGKQQQEFSLGLEKKWGQKIITKTMFIFGEKIEYSQELNYNMFKKFSINMGWFHYNGHNLHGMRHIPNLKEQSLKDSEAWMSIVIKL